RRRRHDPFWHRPIPSEATARDDHFPCLSISAVAPKDVSQCDPELTRAPFPTLGLRAWSHTIRDVRVDKFDAPRIGMECRKAIFGETISFIAIRRQSNNDFLQSARSAAPPVKFSIISHQRRRLLSILHGGRGLAVSK